MGSDRDAAATFSSGPCGSIPPTRNSTGTRLRGTMPVPGAPDDPTALENELSRMLLNGDIEPETALRSA
ncbi:MAG: hypothetical protein ACXVR9_14625 [Gaiellaceae bacterium]